MSDDSSTSPIGNRTMAFPAKRELGKKLQSDRVHMSDESEELDLESDGNDESDITFKEPLPSSDDDEGLHLEKEKEQQEGDPRVEKFGNIELNVVQHADVRQIAVCP